MILANLKEMLLSKALTCMILFPELTKMAILSWRRIPMDILLFGQFIHLSQITLRPNIQLLSTQQHYSRFCVTSWFYSVYNIVGFLRNTGSDPL